MANSQLGKSLREVIHLQPATRKESNHRGAGLGYALACQRLRLDADVLPHHDVEDDTPSRLDSDTLDELLAGSRKQHTIGVRE